MHGQTNQLHFLSPDDKIDDTSTILWATGASFLNVGNYKYLTKYVVLNSVIFKKRRKVRTWNLLLDYMYLKTESTKESLSFFYKTTCNQKGSGVNFLKSSGMNFFPIFLNPIIYYYWVFNSSFDKYALCQMKWCITKCWCILLL